MNKLKLAVDSYYYSETDCYTVGVLFDEWKSAIPKYTLNTHTKKFMNYIPGKFFLRELPGILDLLKETDLGNIDTIIIDGYCWLNDRKTGLTEGLGAHLHDALPKEFQKHIDIIGVGKTLYGKRTPGIYKEITRGRALKPLFITDYDLALNNKAAMKIKSMAGRFRIPYLLKYLDDRTKELDLFRDIKSYKEPCRKRYTQAFQKKR